MRCHRPFTVAVVTAVLAGFLAAPHLSVATPPEGQPSTSTGQKIGTIVKDAIDTALPVVGSVLNLFKKDSEKKSKSEVEEALKKEREAARKRAQDAIKPVARVAAEVDVVRRIAASVSRANLNVSTMQVRLTAAKPDYVEITNDWNAAKSYLSDVFAVSGDEISNVREVAVRQRLLDLKDLQRDLVGRVDSSLNEKQAAKLAERTAALAAVLRGFDVLAAAELQLLHEELKSLSEWANTAAPLGATAVKVDPHLLKFVDEQKEFAAARNKE